MIATEFRTYFSFAQGDDTIGDCHDFGKFRRDYDERHPLPCQFVHKFVDLVLGKDVDATRWLVEEEHLRTCQQPFCQHNLLLVAAAELSCQLFERIGLDAQSLTKVFGYLVFLALIQKPDCQAFGQ